MKQRVNELSLVVFLACALLACDPKIDFDNIDPSVKAEMGIALPVGEFGITLGDLIPTNESVLSVNEQGVYQLSTGFDFSQTIDDIDVSQYAATTEKTLFISESVNNLPAIAGPLTLPLEFELKMGMDGVNQTLQDERIDSMRLTSATLIANITQNFGLSANNIQKAELILSDDFHRAAGNTIDLPFTSFNTPTNITLDNFSINFLKDPTLPAADDNVKDTITLKLRLTLNLAAGEMITLNTNSKFTVNVTVRINDYEAVYGRLVSNTEVGIQDCLELSEMWEGFSNLQNFHLNLYDPTISFDLTTSIGTPIRFHLTEFKSENQDGTDVRYAQFNGSNEYEVSLPNYVKVTDSYDQTATNTIVFNRENGNIGRLFEISPYRFCYNLGFIPEARNGSDQQRIVKGRNFFQATVKMTLPFAFDEGVSLEYKDTIPVDFSAVNLDSLLEEVEFIDNVEIRQLHLVLGLQNTLPFDVDASFAFLNANQQDLDIRPTEDGAIHIAGPKEYGSNGPIPGVGNTELVVNDEMVDKLKDVRYLVFNISAKDPQSNLYPLTLEPENGLKIKIALTADVAAYMNLIFAEK
ncbi:MAG: hypothetical protein MST03_07845 [Bacteroidales bacterium]|nr:hypothetical protein [Bacteroidales bacterium]